MICNKGHKINLSEQVRIWEENHGDDCGLDMILMIDCEECGEQVAMLNVCGLCDEDFEEVDTDFGKVRMPKE